MKIFLTESEVIELAYDALDMIQPDPDKVHDIALRMDMKYDEYLDLYEDVEEISLRKYKRKIHLSTKDKGLIKKYNITKSDGSPVDENAEYFVLRLDNNGNDAVHIEACRHAINKYADKISNHIPLLAKELKEKYPV